MGKPWGLDWKAGQALTRILGAHALWVALCGPPRTSAPIHPPLRTLGNQQARLPPAQHPPQLRFPVGRNEGVFTGLAALRRALGECPEELGLTVLRGSAVVVNALRDLLPLQRVSIGC